MMIFCCVTLAAALVSTPPLRTQRILEKLENEGDGLGAGTSGTYKGLVGLDAAYKAMIDGTRPPIAPFVSVVHGDHGAPAFDVCVLGGTLGIFIAARLQRMGLKCAVVERGAITGRNQEWNLSLDEVEAVLEADGAVETPGKFEVLEGPEGTLVASHFGSVRAGFNSQEGGATQAVWLPDVLNIGVRPDVAVARALNEFKDNGGVVFENTKCAGVRIFDDAAVVDADTVVCTSKLVLDAMGNGSPAARQSRAEANGGVEPKPSGICCVVGTAASGFEDNSFGDLIYTNEDSRLDRQYFWEAFPARSIGETARTTYLFTYLDADRHASLVDQFEDYWKMLPLYQRSNARCFEAAGTNDRPDLVDRALDDGALTIHRCLYGVFPTYKDSPLRSRWDRVLAVGDASGVQSPLSFGGFGALTRHLGRIADAVGDAIEADALTAEDLGTINAYTPNLAATWMFQKSFVVDESKPPDFVNRLMRVNYDNMRDLGDGVLRPFNQDVVRPRGLLQVLALATIRDPANIPTLIYHIGIPDLVAWLGHVANMLIYDAAHHALGHHVRALANTRKDPRVAFRLNRLADAWEFGSGNDYTLVER